MNKPRGKPVTLATAGTKLTGPPEGYGRKKELQVKHWLVSAQLGDEAGAPDITAEPSVYPNQSLDDVYRQLRDSTDRIPAYFGTAGDESTAAVDAEEPVSPPAKAPAAEVVPAQAATAPAPSATSTADTAQAPSDTQAVARDGDSRQNTSHAKPTSLKLVSTAVPQQVTVLDEAAAPSLAGTNGVPAYSITSPKSPLLDAAAAAAAAAGLHSFGNNSQQLLPLSAAAANLYQVLASAEAGDAMEGSSNTELQQLQQALLQLTQEHQDYVNATSAELAAAHAAAESARSQATADAAASQQALSSLQQRLAAAEADAAAARSAGLQAKQEAQRMMIDRDDVAAEQLEHLQDMQQQLKEVTQQMCQQDEQHQQDVTSLQQQLQDAKQQVSNARHELELSRSQAAIKESSLMMQLQAVKSQLAQLQQQCSTQQQELQQLQQDCKEQRAARQAAETAEEKALQLAAERAQMFETLLLEIQHGTATAQRHSRALQTSSMAMQLSRQAAQQSAVAADQPQRLQRPRSAAAAVSNSTAAVPAADGSADATASVAVADKARQRKQLVKGVAADKKVLSDLAAAQRRAAAAAQLEESSKVQQMLTAAPEALRVLGLAFRACVLLPPQHPSDAAAQQLAQQLSQSYHLYVDRLNTDSSRPAVAALATAANTSSQTGRSCDTLTTAVLGVSAALIIMLPTQQSEADDLLMSPPCLGLMHSAVRQGLPVMFVGQQRVLNKDQLLTAAAAAGWSQQDQSALAGHLGSRSVVYDSTSATQDAIQHVLLQLQQLLGLTDLQLSLLPPAALKKLAAAVSGKVGVPDLQYLNSQALTHLNLDLAAMTAAAGSALQQQQQQGGVASPNMQQRQQQVQQIQPGFSSAAEGVVVDLVRTLLAGNRTLKVLKLDGATSTAAAAIADAIVGYKANSQHRGSGTGSGGCQLSLLGINGLLVPVAALLASSQLDSTGLEAAGTAAQKAGISGLPELDVISGSLQVPQKAATSSRPGTAKAQSVTQQQQGLVALLTEPQAVFLATLLPRCSSLIKLQLPLLAVDVSDEVAGQLADAVMQLKNLKSFNGVQLASVLSVGTSSSSSSRILDYQQQGGSGGPTEDSKVPAAVLNLAGRQLGAVGAAVVAKAVESSSGGFMGLPVVADLRGCNIGPHGAAKIAHSLSQLCNSSSSASRNKTPTLPVAVQPAATTLLRELHLSGNQLGHTGLRQLLSALHGSGPMESGTSGASSLLQQLEVLDISYNNLTSEGCSVLAQYVAELQSLQVLDLTGNDISADGAKALFGICMAGNSSRRELHSSRTSTGSNRRSTIGTPSSNSDQLQVGGMNDFMPVLPKLRVLQQGCNVIGDAGVAALAAALPSLTNLQQLGLQENYSIGTEGIRCLAAAFDSAPNLTNLNLAKNSIGVQGAKLLAAGLQANAAAAANAPEGAANLFVGLRHLELEWCKLRTEGVIHIASALASSSPGFKGSSSLKRSAGASNGPSSSSRGGSSGAAVAVHCCLQRLGLSRNGAGDKGVQALVEALATNTSLTHLDLRHNSIGLTGCRLLSGLLQGHNSTIQALQLAGNMDNTEDETPILQALEELAAADRSSLKNS